MNDRPQLDKQITIENFKEFYWYKKELVDFCRSEKLDKRGAKIELSNRIEKYLATGEKESYRITAPKSSRFDWKNEKLTIETVITDNYQNSENVRAFFKNQLGDRFKFNVKFMNWMKTAQGQTLGDAIDQWISITNKMRSDKSHKQIAPQFEYNRYIRDFMKDNPGKSLQEAIRCWKIKKSKPGDNQYIQNDLI